MEKSENAVRSRLLEAGKEEFRDRGFLKASLRAICKKADVTTGALYFFFESKVALFEEIVEETVEDLKRIMGDFTDQEKQLHPEEYDRILMEFIWENRDKLEIINQGNTAFFESFRKTAQNCMSTEKRSHRRRRQRMPSEKKARIWQTIYWENRAKSARSGWIRWICVKGCQLWPG